MSEIKLSFVGNQLWTSVDHDNQVRSYQPTHQPLLPGLEKLLTPPVIQIRIQPLAATQRGDAFLAPQPLEHNPNLLFR